MVEFKISEDALYSSMISSQSLLIFVTNKFLKNGNDNEIPYSLTHPSVYAYLYIKYIYRNFYSDKLDSKLRFQISHAKNVAKEYIKLSKQARSLLKLGRQNNPNSFYTKGN